MSEICIVRRLCYSTIKIIPTNIIKIFSPYLIEFYLYSINIFLRP